MFDSPKETDRIILSNPVDINVLYGNITKQYILQAKPQASGFARFIRNENDAKTVRKIWEYCRNNFTYKFDGYPDSQEIVRMPNASFADKAIDCEDFVILIAATLLNLKIPFIVRFSTYTHTPISHIYIIAIIKNRKVIIDPCNPEYNQEFKGIFWDTYYDANGKIGKITRALGQAQFDAFRLGNIGDIQAFAKNNPNILFGTMKPSEYKPYDKPYFKDNHGYVQAMMNSLRDNKKENKVSSQNLAKTYGITVQTEVKELTELAIVKVARELAHQQNKTVEQKYQDIVQLYQNQVRLNHRSSESIMFQQYSTPAPISYLMGVFVGIDKQSENKRYLEPSAGNGLLTIAGNEKDFYVNEISDFRFQNLKTQNYHEVTRVDASQKLADLYYKAKSFDGIITNPPFGKLPVGVMIGKGEATIKVQKLDHLMALRALDCMKDDGKAAIILGGHTSYDEQGRIKARTSGGSQASGDRYFYNYLYHNYNVKDIILIDGDLYARQGTQFDVRVVLIDGRKATPAGFAPLKDQVNTEVVKTFDELVNRFMGDVIPDELTQKFIKPNTTKIIIEEEKSTESIKTTHKVGDIVLDLERNTKATINKITKPKERGAFTDLEGQRLDITREDGKKAINMPGSRFQKIETTPTITEGMGLKMILMARQGTELFTYDGWVYEIGNEISGASLISKREEFKHLLREKRFEDFYEFDKFYFDVSILKEYRNGNSSYGIIGEKLVYHVFKVNPDGSIKVLLTEDSTGNPFKNIIPKIEAIVNHNIVKIMTPQEITQNIIHQNELNQIAWREKKYPSSKGVFLSILETKGAEKFSKEGLIIEIGQIMTEQYLNGKEEGTSRFFKNETNFFEYDKFYFDVTHEKIIGKNGFIQDKWFVYHLFKINSDGSIKVLLMEDSRKLIDFTNTVYKINSIVHPTPHKDLTLLKLRAKALKIKALALSLTL